MSNENNGYIIPKEMKSEILIKGNLTLKDVIIIAIFGILGFLMAKMMEAGIMLTTILIIAQLALGFVATMKPPRNPDKPMYLVIITLFMQDRNSYKSLDRSKYCKEEVL